MKLSTSTALVTGAGNGMGRQLVIGLIKKGAKVAALDIDASALSETKRLAGASEDNFKAFVVDITDADKVGTLPKTIAEEFSPIDLLINNAGIIQPFVRIPNQSENTSNSIGLGNSQLPTNKRKLTKLQTNQNETTIYIFNPNQFSSL